MILDSYKPNTLILQIAYADAFEIWDRAGAIGRSLCKIWPGLRVQDGKPQYQTYSGRGVTIQTGISDSTVTVKGDDVFSSGRIAQLQDTYALWREMLDLSQLKRASSRVIYVKKFDTMAEASVELRGMKLVDWPESKVFDQPMESELNGVEVTYKFEDKSSFAFLRLKAEMVKIEVDLDPEFFPDDNLSKTINRLLIDFDRGLLGTVDAEKFRVDEWIRGFQHVLRRDIEKVLKARTS